jgi:hypothetical protein
VCIDNVRNSSNGNYETNDDDYDNSLLNIIVDRAWAHLLKGCWTSVPSLNIRFILRGPVRHIWEDNIKMDFQDVGWRSVDWINLAEHRDEWRALVNVVTNLRVP